MPIYANDEVVAYLFVGMGIEDIVENENELMTNALDMSPTLNKKLLEKSINDVPKYSREKLDAYASLLPLISQYIETNNLLSDTDMTVGQLVKAYIKNNLSKKITLSELSWKLHCSTVTLTEHFKKEFGITIMEYVTQKRMDKAKRLLENSDLSVREISEACGFSDIEYFSRSFKGIYKMSPSGWRKTHSKVMASTVKRQRSEKKPIKAEEGSEKSEASTKNNAIASPSSQESGSAEIEKNETEQEKAERLDKENMEKLFRQFGSCFE
jgi:AraC-like DNA-binding protein